MSAQSTDDRVDPQVIRTAMVLVVGGLAVVFDTTIVSVALHSIAAQLDTSIATIQWVSTGYLLGLGVTIPLVGWAQSRFGGRRLWLFALLLFLAASIASSLAWSASSLITFRVVQGIGGGVMLPLMSTLVMQAAGGKSLGRTMSVISLPAILGPVLGPVLGGAILSRFDWRWLFWVNVPFCVVGFLLARTYLSADRESAHQRLDLMGFLLLAPGIVGILVGLSNAGAAGGFARPDVLVPMMAGTALLTAFTLHATRFGRRALVDVRLFAHRGVASSAGLLFLSGAALYGAMLLLPLYFQDIRGADALTAGLVLVPQGVGTLLSRSLAGRLTDSVGARWVALMGFAIVGAATVPFALATATSSEVILVVALLARGFGLGAVTIPLMTAAFVGLDRSEVPYASIITRIAQQIGGSFGVALLAVILDSAVATTTGGDGPSVPGFEQAFWWATGFTGLAMLLALALPGRPRAAIETSPAQGSRPGS